MSHAPLAISLMASPASPTLAFLRSLSAPTSSHPTFAHKMSTSTPRARAPGPQPVKAVLFDSDGLLIDSETIYTDVVNEVLKPYGKEQTWEIKERLMGRSEKEATEILLGALWPPRPSHPEEKYDVSSCPFEVPTFLKDRNDLLLKAFETVKPMPGAERLVKHLAKHKVPICVATGSKRPNYEIKSGANPELYKWFEGRAITGSDERLKRAKPAPDIFLLAAREGLGLGEAFAAGIREQGEENDGQLKGGEGAVLVFEDATNGVEAGIAAGMQVAWVPDANLLKVVGDDIGATVTLKGGLMDFRPEMFGLPPFEDGE